MDEDKQFSQNPSCHSGMQMVEYRCDQAEATASSSLGLSIYTKGVMFASTGLANRWLSIAYFTIYSTRAKVPSSITISYPNVTMTSVYKSN